MIRHRAAFKDLSDHPPDLSDVTPHPELRLTRWFNSVARKYREVFGHGVVDPGSVGGQSLKDRYPTETDARAWLECIAAVSVDRTVPPGHFAFAIACFTLNGRPVLDPRLAAVYLERPGLIVVCRSEQGNTFRVSASTLVVYTQHALLTLADVEPTPRVESTPGTLPGTKQRSDVADLQRVVRPGPMRVPRYPELHRLVIALIHVGGAAMRLRTALDRIRKTKDTLQRALALGEYEEPIRFQDSQHHDTEALAEITAVREKLRLGQDTMAMRSRGSPAPMPSERDVPMWSGYRRLDGFCEWRHILQTRINEARSITDGVADKINSPAKGLLEQPSCLIRKALNQLAASLPTTAERDYIYVSEPERFHATIRLAMVEVDRWVSELRAAAEQTAAADGGNVPAMAPVGTAAVGVSATSETPPATTTAIEYVRSDDAASRSGLSTETIRMRAKRENWPIEKSGKMNCYPMECLTRAWPNRKFRPNSGKN